MKTFEYIKDTRFSKNPFADVVRMSNELEKNIVDVAILKVSPIREISFPDGTISYRRKFEIEKRNGYKWDDIYEIVNKIQAPVYKNK
jgi:hypothetical protein